MSWHQRVALFIRSNLFIPDARSPWIGPSVGYLSKYLTQNPVDLIISTGPPHSCHLIGLGVKQKTQIPWIADFRDPWTDIEFFPMLQLTSASRRKHQRFEKEVLTHADKVITVSWSWADLLKRHGAKDVEILTNGYDQEDIAHVQVKRKPGKIVFASVGTLEEDRNPRDLWAALSRLFQHDPSLEQKLELHLIGQVDTQILESIKDSRVRSILHVHGYVPHAEAMEITCNADVLILSLNKSHAENARGLIPGKVFEYIATGNVVLVTGDQESDVGRLVSQYAKGYVAHDGDIDTVYRYLLQFVSTDTHGLTRQGQTMTPERFERRHLTGTLVQIMQSLSRVK